MVASGWGISKAMVRLGDFESYGCLRLGDSESYGEVGGF